MILMNGVDFIIGTDEINRTPLTAYSDEAVAFITDLSAQIMRSPLLREYPDIAALGFWGRKGNILSLKKNCPESNIRLGRGVCFHIAPSNIPMSFAFSYLFGLLAGCSNIVRLPSKKFPQTEEMLKVISRVLKDHPEIETRSVFVRYPAEKSITEELSLLADARMIWGGDETVGNIRKIIINPKCIDIAFSDRYSFCIVDGDAVLNADERIIKRLAGDFYNDTYLMDQNACSSPQMICWLQDSKAARDRFWSAVSEIAQKKYHLQATVCVDKYTQSCEDAIDRADNVIEIIHDTNLLYRAQVKKLTSDIEGYRGNGGYFYEYSMDGLNDMVSVVTERFQTVTYFGIDPDEILKTVIEQKLRGIDRIVPIGKAMDIGVIWDGYDLVRMLSRIINVE